ncbi:MULTISPECIES: protocatechuate 3,4-dioxygenase [Vibrio]|uniref:Protocatechuate 3,4-dioxygenase n=1 Tax=Vibrio harveyi TaxID=669 RepID=A0ABM5Y5G9_VIBHA|nr:MULTISPECIES: protocatechuate 3,4-dioxygenase [Vibrio]AMG01001.1 protocatechuate 3,4-dioxygenase [Vibrio harveyi]AYO22846.1 protocatechuate 3,4-dioxygenase [Vibrio owensii]EKO3842246.1 protocatechuate 3,4-dioxygenase [Vibrio harveyi]ELI6427422.1 protocatechuate 3,4-dioxygenase [Vibrio harveyi]ELY1985804.1 protocatechuate 3,4-dioxygenase [Vibrio harveyi]
MERRHFLALWTLLFAPSLKAKTPMRSTPAQTEGPFYPVVDIPLRQNLILQSEGLVGEPIVLQGRVLDTSGNPASGIKVEIWQCDGQGIYDHPKQPDNDKFDAHFTGFGAVETQSDGRYLFQTLYPVPYASRPPHIHVKLWRDNQELLTTQLYLKGNTGDEWWGGKARDYLQFETIRIDGRLTGEFNFVIG